MRIMKFISENILFLITLFLLAFIPLYPKLPIVDIQHTWVYIRAEDFVVLLVLLLWLILLVQKKITLKTPLTLPIILFWIIGVVSTIHGVLLIFPQLTGLYPNVAFLNYLRRIEYMSLFFVAYSGIRDKRFLPYIVLVLSITLLLIIGYGFGQKFLGFPAYLTMNEEFAKGTPLRLSQLSRISSTFGGHYDLAAYLVLIMPILTSMFFGFKNKLVKLSLLITVGLGFALMFMTVSRVSFFVLLLSMILVFLLQKKKIIILSLLLFSFILLFFSQNMLQRFGNTLKEIDVVVSSQTGEAIGHVKEVPADYFQNKIIRIKYAQTKNEIDNKPASSSALVTLAEIPPYAPLVVESNSPTGENLPQGTGYVNLALSPITKKMHNFFYQKSTEDKAVEAEDIVSIRGNFLVKRALAYDLSFTTRFQGEWPRAIEAFKRNIFLGSGYSSVSLAVDNNYLRILGEVGLLGFISFMGIFLLALIYVIKIFPDIDSNSTKSFIIGFFAGLFGLALNAIFIDVFEASKIAFILWLLIGITAGVTHLYQKNSVEIYKQLKNILFSTYAIVIYIFIVTILVFSSIVNYYFVADDFTWFRWTADVKNQSIIQIILNYFTDTNGFFYRPGTKIYFLIMYSGFWLNQTVYHIVSIFLHFTTAVLLFLITKKILNSSLLSFSAALVFITLSSYSEAVFWISSTGFLFNAFFLLLGLYLFMLWEEERKKIYFIFSLIALIFSLLFHELGVVGPLLLLLYKFSFKDKFSLAKLFNNNHNLILFIPILPYLVIRYFSNSHWLNGDYSYNLLKLPYNIIGNTLGYFSLLIFGPQSLFIYEKLRIFSKGHIIISTAVSLLLIFILIRIYRRVIKKIIEEERKIIIFGFLFFIIALLPFLGLGNITSRYSYLASIGFIILFVFFLKKIYVYLLNTNGRYIAAMVVTLITFVFAFVHIIQQQKINGDWNEAGKKSRNFLVSLDKSYMDYWLNEPMQFYFVNIPTKYQEAWVFPVGLPDALWLNFRQYDIKVSKFNSLTTALDAAEASANARVFEFNDDGTINYVTRIKETQTIIRK